ncbi:MAG: hypothetical protein NZM37_10540 [Sandaracinaceae bacterium]|nr:hypothetical protein [Sandaracinaceae bacterium]MDW8247124.1 hypothetical protein [Sandaracinaceae bacterium]
MGQGVNPPGTPPPGGVASEGSASSPSAPASPAQEKMNMALMPTMMGPLQPPAGMGAMPSVSQPSSSAQSAQESPLGVIDPSSGRPQDGSTHPAPSTGPWASGPAGSNSLANAAPSSPSSGWVPPQSSSPASFTSPASSFTQPAQGSSASSPHSQPLSPASLPTPLPAAGTRQGLPRWVKLVLLGCGGLLLLACVTGVISFLVCARG